jgi:hypothetical protein
MGYLVNEGSDVDPGEHVVVWVKCVLIEVERGASGAGDLVVMAEVVTGAMVEVTSEGDV